MDIFSYYRPDVNLRWRPKRHTKKETLYKFHTFTLVKRIEVKKSKEKSLIVYHWIYLIGSTIFTFTWIHQLNVYVYTNSFRIHPIEYTKHFRPPVSFFGGWPCHFHTFKRYTRGRPYRPVNIYAYTIPLFCSLLSISGWAELDCRNTHLYCWYYSNLC